MTSTQCISIIVEYITVGVHQLQTNVSFICESRILKHRSKSGNTLQWTIGYCKVKQYTMYFNSCSVKVGS